MLAEKKLEELGIKLPACSKPLAMYIPVVRVGNTIYVSGQGPFVNGQAKYAGKVSETAGFEEGKAAARLCVVNLLAALKSELGDLDKVRQIANITVYVNSAPGFNKQHLIANAASELLFNVFGEKGRHSRTALGCSDMGADIMVEVSAVVIAED